MIPPENDLAAMLKVSRVTVRRALDVLSKKDLLERRRGSGTFVRSWVECGDVAVLLASDPLLSAGGWTYKMMLSAAEKIITSAGSRAHLALGYGTHSTEYASTRGVVDTLLKAGVGGALCLNFDPRPFKDTISARRLPTVALLGADVGWKHSVVFDYMSMVSMASGMFRKRRIRDIAVVSFDLPKYDLDKEVGAQMGRAIDFLRSQFNADVHLLPYSLDGASSYEHFKMLWGRPKRPRTIFFLDEFICDPATRAILELGIKVPEELAILTHSSIGRNFIFPVRLTRVGFDLEFAVQQSLELLFRIMKKGDQGRRLVRIPSVFTAGKSL